MKNKLSLKLALILLVLLCVNNSMMSQRNPDKVVTYEANIETILINPYTGSIIVKDRDAISSYNPDTDKMEWKVNDKDLSGGNLIGDAQKALDVMGGDFGALLEKKKDVVEFIHGSPFISLSMDNKDLILNSVNGELVYNSATFGFRLLSAEYMPEERAMLLTVIDGKQYSAIFYDLVSKSQKWTTELAPIESFLKSLKGIISLNPEDVTENMVLTTENNLFITINGTLYSIEKQDGKILWKTDFKVNRFEINKANTHLISVRQTGNFLRRRTALNLLDVNTGEKVWKDDIVTKYVTYLEDDGDKLMVAHAGGFNIFKYADGKKVWAKDAKGNNIKQVIPVDDDYLYIADKEMNLIDKDGKNKWKKFVEICDKDEDVVYHLNKIDNNRVFYLSDAYGNMVDYTTGKKVWKKDVKFNRDRPLLFSYDADRNVYIAYNDKKIYRFDPNGKDEKKNEPFAKLKDVKSDDTMSDIELFDWGVSLVSEEDVMGVDFDGKVIYHNKYKEPGSKMRSWLKAGQAVGNLGMGALMAKDAMVGAGKAIMTGKDEISGAERNRLEGAGLAMGALNSGFMDKAIERARALKSNNEYAFVLNKAEKGGTEIVKVRKADGNEVDRLQIEGNKPIYEVDAVNDNLYFVKGKELRIYSKK